jgi:hypothetical protein
MIPRVTRPTCAFESALSAILWRHGRWPYQAVRVEAARSTRSAGIGLSQVATTSTKSAAITVDQYERMIDAGTIAEDAPVELIEGRLVPRMTKQPDRMSASSRARRAIESVLPSGWHVRIEGPVRSGIASPSRTWPWSGENLTTTRTGIRMLERSPSSWRLLSRAWPRTANLLKPTEAAGSRSTGSSTWFTASSKSMPGRRTARTLLPRSSRKTISSI